MTTTMVINRWGTEIYNNVAEMLMDTEIAEMLHNKMAPCTEQAFFEAYCKAHEKKYGEEFELAKLNPVY